MKIASWNVNSVRARLANITNWLEAKAPDVVLLQEIKCQTSDFPTFEFQSLGYECHVVGQKSYNGVALLSKHKVTNLITALPGDQNDEQARFVQGTIKNMDIAGLYLPNGNPITTDKFTYKLNWMERLYDHVKAHLPTERPFILGGDYNVIPTAKDAHDITGWENDALHHPQTLSGYRKIINLGMTEAFRTLHPDTKEFTFWDYQGGAWQRNLGLRIDHFLLSPEAADKMEACEIDREPRGQEKASDHTPIVLTVRD